MGRGELRAKLVELEEDRETAEREMAAIKSRRERLEQMERDRDAVVERYSGVVPESFDELSPEERHQVYKMLRLEVLAYPDKSLEVRGAILAGEEGGSDRGGPNAEGPGGGDLDGALPIGVGLGALEPSRTSSVHRRTPRVAYSPRSTTTPWPSCSPTVRHASCSLATLRRTRKSICPTAYTLVP